MTFFRKFPDFWCSGRLNRMFAGRFQVNSDEKTKKKRSFCPKNREKNQKITQKIFEISEFLEALIWPS